MGSVSDYQSRAKQCSERARIVGSAIDQARWRQLADQWMALSRLPLQKDGIWRGEPSGLLRREPLTSPVHQQQKNRAS
jgi:hypothetical protein